jgi:hypothetical protein
MRRPSVIAPIVLRTDSATGLCLLGWDFRFQLDLPDGHFSLTPWYCGGLR